MRIPLCQKDLPDGFNKLAKYFGRHWPGGKLKLSQSRERLALMMGYTSSYAVSREVVPEAIINDLEWELMLDSVYSKALALWNVDPIEFAQLLKRVPWWEIRAGQVSRGKVWSGASKID